MFIDTWMPHGFKLHYDEIQESVYYSVLPDMSVCLAGRLSRSTNPQTHKASPAIFTFHLVDLNYSLVDRTRLGKVIALPVTLIPKQYVLIIE